MLTKLSQGVIVIKLLASRAMCAALLLSTLILSSLSSASNAPNSTGQTFAAGHQASSPAASVTQRFPVIVTDDEGRFVFGLTKDDFAFVEGKSQREIRYFNTDDVPASVGVLIDVSRSMKSQGIAVAKQTAARFIGHSHPENEYFIGEFLIPTDFVGSQNDAAKNP
ncbi:MAG: hypothetical protein ACR2G4_15410 [Pyrinomonadaceae bacterium]